MRTVWLVLVVVSACGGGSSGPADALVLIDARPDAAIDAPVVIDAPLDAPPDSITLIDAPIDSPGSTVCNPLTQAGCTSGEKCTWLNDQDSPPIGHIACAPDGVISIGGACTAPPAGPLGYDACAKGSACLGGVCKQICDHLGGAPTCDANHVCTRYANFFVSAGTTVAGVCDPLCDPLTQDLIVGTPATACGSPAPSQPTKGCYGYSAYSCAPASMATWTLTDRTTPQGGASANLNGCAPGFVPFFYAATGSTMTVCSGYCAALEIDNTAAHVGNTKGNPTALAKLPLSAAPIAGDGTCDIGKKGSHVSSTCNFIWPYLVDNFDMLPPAFENGPHLDTLGVCFARTFYSYDSNFDSIPDTTFPDCTTLPPRSLATTGDFDDAADWGCQKRSNAQFIAGPKTHNPALFDLRIGGGSAVPMLRHTFD